MENKEAILILREYNKWRRGKGKKYSQPGMPLDVKKIDEAIDHSIHHLKYRLDPIQFNDITYAAYLTLLHFKKHRKDIDDKNREQFEKYLSELSAAIKAANKIRISIKRRAEKAKKK